MPIGISISRESIDRMKEQSGSRAGSREGRLEKMGIRGFSWPACILKESGSVARLQLFPCLLAP